jgi:hypothetical protein
MKWTAAHQAKRPPIHLKLIRKHELVLSPIESRAAMCFLRRSLIDWFLHLKENRDLSYET